MTGHGGKSSLSTQEVRRVDSKYCRLLTGPRIQQIRAQNWGKSGDRPPIGGVAVYGPSGHTTHLTIAAYWFRFQVPLWAFLSPENGQPADKIVFHAHTKPATTTNKTNTNSNPICEIIDHVACCPVASGQTPEVHQRVATGTFGVWQ
eukprot:CAMPEP_0174305952 /NCGR_PEP_ID=MMETSP0810-20121108/134_1 /TAXON_ID=73025 ORGANISM="Eutreptiella gymnastica-like, Strain CCMP1594" /NCGR_SAMPLE_ID=MMETSP0810 /ASSEMBLY_ACC=CAM_ASM_000659 /LENGTH=146 /DNA_ID=CAMNT_0015412519 /DNA_START=28 /DNA_END=468 /DNA_ORIENTATION=-